MSLYTKALRHIDMNRVKELREENIKKQKLAEVKFEQEKILAELKKIEAEEAKHINWRRELEEGMTTSGLGMINLEASDDALANIDVSDNTVSAVNSSVTSGGSGTSWNTGLNMGTEMISIAGSSNAKSFTLGSVDTSRATTITFKSLQGEHDIVAVILSTSKSPLIVIPDTSKVLASRTSKIPVVAVSV